MNLNKIRSKTSARAMGSLTDKLDSLQTSLVLAQELALEIARAEGEITQEVETKILSLDLMKRASVEGLIELDAWANHKAEDFKALSKSLQNKAKKMEGLSSYIRSYFEGVMQRSNVKKLEGDFHWATLIRNKPTMITEEGFHDPAYVKIVQIMRTEVDKESLRKDLENGEKVSGASLLETFRVQMYPRKEKEDAINPSGAKQLHE